MENIRDKQIPKVQLVWNEVEILYEQLTTRKKAYYLWKHHIQTVVSHASKLSKRFNGNQESVVAGALLHDIADVWMERDDNAFEAKTHAVVKRILTKSGFSLAEAIDIKNNVIDPHSCYPDNLPSTIDGKILATADALAHLTTNFYNDAYEVFFSEKMTTNEYKQWVLKKIERDFNDKIFFDEVREDARELFEKIKERFCYNIE